MSTDCEIYHTLSISIARRPDGKGRDGSHLRDTCEGGPRSVPRGLELGARGGLGRALPGRSTGVLSHGRGRADGFSGPPAGAAPRKRRVARVVRWGATRWSSVLLTYDTPWTPRAYLYARQLLGEGLELVLRQIEEVEIVI